MSDRIEGTGEEKGRLSSKGGTGRLPLGIAFVWIQHDWLPPEETLSLEISELTQPLHGLLILDAFHDRIQVQ